MVRRWTTDAGIAFAGKAAAHACHLHKEAEVKSFKTSSLPVKKKEKKINQDFSSATAQQQLCLPTSIPYTRFALDFTYNTS